MSSNDPIIDAENDPDSDGSELEQEGLSSTDQKIETIVEAFLSNLRSGKRPNVASVLDEYPEIAEPLEKRLRFFESAFEALSSAASSIQLEIPSPELNGDSHSQSFSLGMGVTRDAAVRLDCPHCGNRILVVGSQNIEITCGSCGSVVSTDFDITRTDLPPEDMPKKIARFEVRRVLGQGAFGRVYLAYDPDLSRQVAIKVPRYGYFSSSDEEQRFLREAKNIAQLRHQNVIQVFEVSQVKQTPFIVCEFIDGLTLSDIASSGTLKPKEIATILLQVSEGVHYAHENGIIHRDLKPGNILLDNQRNPYVADFGLARQDNVEIAMTLDGDVMGTPAYMSPEQAEGVQSEIDAQSDVYSLGVILYRLLCNELPFHGTKRMLMHQVLHDEPKPPSKLNDKIPRDLETITLTAMAKEKSKRYKTAKEFGDELRRWLRNEPIVARPIGWSTRTIRWCRRKPVIASLIGAIASLLMIGAIGSAIWAVQSDRLEKIASNNAETATKEKDISNLRLKTLYLNKGVADLEQQEMHRSALWFSKAAELEAGNEAVHRTRLGMVQDQSPKLENVFAIDGTPVQISFSPDGQRLFVACLKGNCHVFDVPTRKQLFMRQMHEPIADGGDYGSITLRSVYLPDGIHIAIVTNAQEAQIWNVETSRRIGLLSHDHQILELVGSKDGNFVATGDDGGTVKVWNVADGALAKTWTTPNQDPIVSLKLLDGANKILAATRVRDSLNYLVRRWDFENQQETLFGEAAEGFIWQTEITQDGKTLATSNENGEIRFWNLDDGTEIGASINKLEAVHRVFFSDDGKELFSVSSDGDLDRWSLENRKQIDSGRRQSVGVIDAASDAQRKLVATANKDGSVNIYWRKFSRKPICVIRNGLAYCELAFHPKRPRVAIGSDDGIIQIWNLASCAPDSVRVQHDAEVWMAKFSTDGSRALTAGRDRQAKVWDAHDGKPLSEPLDFDSQLNDLAVSKNNQFFAASAGKVVRIFDVFTGTQIGSDMEHENEILRIEFDRKSERLYSMSEDGEVKAWNISSVAGAGPIFVANHGSSPNEINSLISSREATVGEIEFSDDDKFFVTSYVSNSRVWDVETGLPISGAFETPGAVDMSIFIGNEKVVSCCDDGIAYVWNVGPQPVVVAKLQHQAHVTSVAISTKTDRLITTDVAGFCNVWNTDNLELIRSFRVSNCDGLKFVTLIEIDDAELVALCGTKFGVEQMELGNGGVQVFNPSTGFPVSPFLKHLAHVRRVNSSNVGPKLISSSRDGTAVIWKMNQTQENFATLTRYFQLMTRTSISENGEIEVMQPAKTLSEFESLLAAESDSSNLLLKSTPTEEAQWDEWVEYLDSIK